METVIVKLTAAPPYDFELTAVAATSFSGHYGAEIFQDGVFQFINFSLDISSRLQKGDTKALLGRLTAVLRRRGVEFIAFPDYDVNESLIEEL